MLSHIIEADGGFYGLGRYALERRRSRDDRPTKIPEAFWDTIFSPQDEVAKLCYYGPEET
ncbi:MAG: hypothetical protein ACJ8CR_07240 [Roseiflexaceae bacterium]